MFKMLRRRDSIERIERDFAKMTEQLRRRVDALDHYHVENNDIVGDLRITSLQDSLRQIDRRPYRRAMEMLLLDIWTFFDKQTLESPFDNVARGHEFASQIAELLKIRRSSDG